MNSESAGMTAVENSVPDPQAVFALDGVSYAYADSVPALLVLPCGILLGSLSTCGDSSVVRLKPRSLSGHIGVGAVP